MVNLRWNKVSEANGYAIYYRDNTSDKWTKVTTVKSNKTTSYTHKFNSYLKAREYAIRTYKTVNGKNVYGDYTIITVR